MSAVCRIVVLISGNGSNLQAIIDDIANGSRAATICAVISNRADAFGLERAQRAGIATHVIDHKALPDRLSFDRLLQEQIDQYAPDLVVLAGFMRILSELFVQHYRGRLLNIHPSLLPAYKGLHTHQRVLDAREREHGCTVHFVTAELDGGPSIVQAVVPVEPDDDADRLAKKVHRQEHIIYPLAIRWFAEGRLRLSERGVMLDNQDLPPTGHRIHA